MVGESGTSRNQNVHHYYKCVNNKKRRGCTKKAVKKVWIENIVIDETAKLLQDDKFIFNVTEAAYALQQEENVSLPKLQQELSDVEQGIKNLVDAIQQGLFSKSTKSRLDELEAEKEKLELAIVREEISHPFLTREKIRFWLLKFRMLDLSLLDHKKRLVDSFVNSVHVFDDRLVITFNYKDGSKTVMLKDIQDKLGSDLMALLPPKKQMKSGQAK